MTDSSWMRLEWRRRSGGEVNRPTAPAVFDRLLVKVQEHLNTVENVFVKDAFCGADKDYRMPVRLVTEKAWHAAFMHNMFVRATEEEIPSHIPEFTILHVPEMKSSMSDGVNSDVFVIIALDRGMVIIGGLTMLARSRRLFSQ